MLLHLSKKKAAAVVDAIEDRIVSLECWITKKRSWGDDVTREVDDLGALADVLERIRNSTGEAVTVDSTELTITERECRMIETAIHEASRLTA